MGAYTTVGKIWKPAVNDTGWDALVDLNFDRLSELAVNVKAYGALGDGSHDDTTAIQAAIDAADASYVFGEYGAPNVFFPAGKYVITSSLTWKACSLVGEWPHETEIAWNGAGSGTMVVVTATGYKRMARLRLMGGSATPGICVDFATNNVLVDKYTTIENCMFGATTGDAITINDHANLHWTDLRFDAIGGYWIRITPSASTSFSSFVIDRFISDNGGGSGGNGCILVDLATNNNNVSLGNLHLVNGRIEVNASMSAPRAIVHIKPGTTGSTQVFVHLDNVTYVDAAANADYALYRDTASAYTYDQLLLTNCALYNLTYLAGGPGWPSQAPQNTAGGNYSLFTVGGNNVVDYLAVRAFTSGWNPNPIKLFNQDEANERLGISTTGSLGWGSGSATADTNLYRSAANVLKTDDQLAAIDGVTTKYLSAAGKTTVVDGDFTATPPNGTIAIHRDTTANKTYTSVRANGVWTVIAGPL